MLQIYKRIKNFLISRLNLRPDFVKSSKVTDSGMVEENWEVNGEALPSWWDNNCHCFIEEGEIAGSVTLYKYCTKCKSKIPDQGCLHNIKNT